MYTMVLMMSMGGSADVADFGRRGGSCHGNVVSGCYGSGYGYGGCYGGGGSCYGSGGCHGRDRGGFLGLRDRNGCNGGGFLGHHKSRSRGCHGGGYSCHGGGWGGSCHGFGYGAGYGGGCYGAGVAAAYGCCGTGYAAPVASTGCTGMIVGGAPGMAPGYGAPGMAPVYGAPGMVPGAPYGGQPVVMPPAPPAKGETGSTPKKSD